MSMGLADELVEAYADLELIYLPFSEDGKRWMGDVEGLDEIVGLRDRALREGAAALSRIRSTWARWEAGAPATEERARVFSARNRIVELGLAASRADVALQGKVRRRTDEIRLMAADSGRKQKASAAYSTGRRKV
jgi:hypothetical protein